METIPAHPFVLNTLRTLAEKVVGRDDNARAQFDSRDGLESFVEFIKQVNYSLIYSTQI